MPEIFSKENGGCWDCGTHTGPFFKVWMKPGNNPIFKCCDKCAHTPSIANPKDFNIVPLEPIPEPEMETPAPPVVLCDYCQGIGMTNTKKEEPNPAEYKVVFLDSTVQNRFLCQECVSYYKATGFLDNSVTITPINGVVQKTDEKQYCVIKEKKLEGAWNGPCPENSKYEIWINEAYESAKAPVNWDAAAGGAVGIAGYCQYHSELVFKNNEYWKKAYPIKFSEEPVTPTSFTDPEEHKSFAGNVWYCQTKDTVGFDGTANHFGNCYRLRNPEKPGEEWFSCDNHVGEWVSKGYTEIISYGKYEDLINPENKEIPECMTPYVNAKNCHFKGLVWKDVAPACSGPVVGEVRIGNWEPLCKAHFEGSIVKNGGKLSGNFAELRPGQPPKPAPVMKNKDKISSGATPRTQKARGMNVLRRYSFPVPGFKVYDLTDLNPEILVGRFVRPCPVRPRHGFVDSRLINTLEDAKKIIEETLAADPDAEFLIMDHINAPFSGIWTPGYLAVGLGTDGATAGRTAITIPVMGDFLQYVGYYPATIRNEASIEHSPYIEMLWRSKYSNPETVHLENQEFIGNTVQLRDGPKLPEDSDDYIPAEITVENVILADGDLLEWEEKMRHTPPNTVVYHPGGTMASHYSIHAVLNNIPVLITREPKIGEKLVRTQSEPRVNIELMRAGFGIACQMNIAYKDAAYFMVLGCHETSQWLGKYDILLGAAMGFGWRLAVTAALGEARHSKKSGKMARTTVYSKIWKNTDTPGGRERFVAALDLFLNYPKWSSGFGGLKWYNFTVQAAVMYNALIKKEHKQALEAFNKLIHAAHNNGWGFNKFIGEDVMSDTAKNPVYSAFPIGPYLYQVLTASNDTVKSAARSFWKRKPIDLPDNKGTGAEIDEDEESEEDEEEEHDACTCLFCLKIKANENKENWDKLPEPEPENQIVPKLTKEQIYQAESGKKQTVSYAQAKLIPGTKILHIQYKSENCPKGMYWKKDVKCPDELLKNFQKMDYGFCPTNNSLANTDTQYYKLWYKDGFYGLLDVAFKFQGLLPLEITPNAS